MSERIVGWIYDHVWLTLLAGLALTALTGWMALGVGVDNAVEIWFVDDDPALLAYHAFQEEFGNDEVVAIALTDEDGILDAEGLARIRRVTALAVSVEGIAEARSLTNTLDISATSTAVRIDALVSDDLGALDPGFAERILADPLLVDTLVSRDGKTALVHARMDALDNVDAERDAILARLNDAIAEEDARTAGIGVVYAALNQLATVDSAVFIGASYALIILLLWAFYGRFIPMAVSMGIVGVAAIWLMGAFGAGDRDINMVTMVLPTLVVIIGISDCVHILNHAAHHVQGRDDRREAVVEAVGFMFWPCLFNTLTTSMGFLALTTAPMAVVRDLGLYAAIGLLTAFVAAIAGCTIALRSPRAEPRIHERAGPLLKTVRAMVELGIRRPTAVLAGAGLFGLLASVGVSQLEVDTYSIDFLFEDHPVRQDSAAIERSIGAYMPLEIVIRAEDPLDPELLAAIDAWQLKVVDQVDDIGWARSLTDVLKRLEQVLTDGTADNFKVPADRGRIDQGLFFYESEPDNDLDRLMSDGALRVTFGMKMQSARGMSESLDQVLAAAGPELAGVQLVPSGYLPLYVQMMDYIVVSQLTSFGLAFVIIFGLLALLFRSVRLSALALPANLVPVLFVLGVMGLVGIRLDVATVTIAAIVLGLVVDDTVQFLYRFRAELRARDQDHEAALRATVDSVGRSLAVTTLVLALGFSVLGLAQVKSVCFFGVLISLALVAALITDLLVMPALIVLVRPRL